MENSTQFTRCPHCKTAFKVTEKMLAMAHGKVRCGACLAVFQATDYLLKPSQAAVVSAPASQPLSSIISNQRNDIAAKAATSSGAAINKEAASEVDFEQRVEPEFMADIEPATQPHPNDEKSSKIDLTHSDNSDQAEFELPEQHDLGLNTKEATEQSARAAQLGAAENSILAADPQISFDESLSTEEFEEALEQDIDYALTEGSADSAAQSSSQLKNQSDSLALTDNETSAQTPPAEMFDDDELQLIDDRQADNLFEPNSATDDDFEAQYSSQDLENEPPLSEQKASKLVDESLSHEHSAREKQRQQARQNEQSLSQNPSETQLTDNELALQDNEDFDQIADELTLQIQAGGTEPDPLDEFEGRVVQKKTGLRNTVIIAVILIGLTILSLQFWNNRQQLAWDETWGSTTQAICSVLPCQLKPRRDVANIQLRQRIVTPSETDENLLEVKMLLTNEASFDQPFPRINIKFSNSLGEQVAIKQFEVKDYFPEKQDELMPAGSEVHIKFETELPHPDALGFEFIFD